MTKNITIRKALKKDIPFIVELGKELLDFHAELDSFFRRRKNGHVAMRKFVNKNIDDENTLVLVAECGGKVVGYSQSTIEKNPPVLEMKEYGLVQVIAVTGKYQRRGIGKRLFDSARDFFSGSPGGLGGDPPMNCETRLDRVVR